MLTFKVIRETKTQSENEANCSAMISLSRVYLDVHNMVVVMVPSEAKTMVGSRSPSLLSCPIQLGAVRTTRDAS